MGGFGWKETQVGAFLSAIIGVLLLVALLAPTGCQNVGDGKVDVVEAALFRKAVVAALTLQPEAVAPAYLVSAALLLKLDGYSTVRLQDIGSLLDDETKNLNLPSHELKLFSAFASAVRQRIIQGTGRDDVTAEQKIIVVKDLLGIIKTVSFSMGGCSLSGGL